MQAMNVAALSSRQAPKQTQELGSEEMEQANPDAILPGLGDMMRRRAGSNFRQLASRNSSAGHGRA